MKNDPYFKFLAVAVLVGAVVAFTHLSDAKPPVPTGPAATVTIDLPLTP